MNQIKEQLEKISIALCETQNKEQYTQLYAAQQALSWALETNTFAEPYNMIMGIQANSEDYLAMLHPLES